MFLTTSSRKNGFVCFPGAGETPVPVLRETPLFVIFAKFGAVFIAPKWCHGNASKVALPTPTCLEKHRLQQLTTEVMSLSSREQALVLAPELPPP